MWGLNEGMGWWMAFGGMWMIVFWGFVIGLVIWGVRQFARDQRANRAPGETPLEIAQKRLALGEITRDEFEEIKIVLELKSP